ncbi:hypothetical protein GCM10009096_10920 [Parasphingorhabdus litoris]|uniref:Cytochrome c domain-containing protein n=1 Tax=Parasphingorhabdus litoris TaxID=394733 RepID=A0ABN1AAM7_9SPHN|nr:hypothetical protein [Parasphingorhabdus litoris]
MKRALVSATLLALVVSSTAAFASGSTGRGTAGNDWGTKVKRGTNSLISNEDRLLVQGRAQVRRYITCRSCDYHNKLNRETAPEVAQAVRAGRFEIRDNRRAAVLAYIKKRYGI